MTCIDCHGGEDSPVNHSYTTSKHGILARYITRLFDNGERMLDIGRMKVQEAAGVLEQAEEEFSAAELAAAREHFARMQSLHLKNVYLGVGHQSPDYQCWHGQPALDGDLLRIKGALGELRRIPQ